ncbi:alpha/beta fold hydrolase [Priestia endophytica]|jgi:pimeloyl-ACP methyl ester carboxylesterase|uniref:Pimeloyl-ACP methyl ester carboxylesterase n=1 Tax=Priestia endophytica DSM 13796 TaxID=1121089 RepID=A0A1I6BH65_9BACI|nr:alpha/beta hydrolase [Priestia endophytica]KYG25781.1 hydrolase [Priestia endophytica]MBG9811387.1 hydrolase [Priestia endophytica]SFQ80244.1 Pimeloyl-ACP methyl ester carboxylesterase [Priestia endophytica DSM 13796]
MDLYYEVSGNGRPVVLLHSGGADLRDWMFVAPLLAKHYRVIVFDGRGAGKSPSPTEPANYVEDLLVLLDHLEINQATLIGHSLGGRIATDFTLEYPKRVSELVLIAPALSGFRHSQEFEDWMQKINEAAPDIDKIVELSLNAPLYRIIMSSPYRDLMAQMFRDHLKKTSEWGTFKSIWPEPPAIDRLEKIKIKTLFIIGEEELSDNRRVAECFRKVPDIRFIHIAGSDHMVTLTHPNELYSHITDFLDIN